MHLILKEEQYYAIINTSTGVWYNGSIGVSKTFDGSSILSTPAKWKSAPTHGVFLLLKLYSLKKHYFSLLVFFFFLS